MANIGQIADKEVGLSVRTKLNAAIEEANKVESKLNADGYTAADVKAKYEENENTNAFTDDEKQKLEQISSGADGREVELAKSDTHVQWRYVGDELWVDLVALADLEGTTGDDGPAIELQTTETMIQWRVVGDVDWIDLIAQSELKGDPGEDAVLPADNVTGTGITHIAAVTEYPDTEVSGTLYVLLPEVPA